MDDKDRIVVASAEAGVEFMDNNPTDWNTDLHTVDVHDELVDQIAATKAHDQIANTNQTGVAGDLGAAKLKGAKKAMLLVGPLKSFARSTDNLTLKGEINFTFSDLFYHDKETVALRWKTVNDRATTNLAAMITAHFPITGAGVTESVDARQDYIDNTGSPRAAKVVQKTANKDMKGDTHDTGDIQELRDLMEELLYLSEAKKESNHDYYSGLHSAFKRVGGVARHIFCVIKYVDDATGVPLKDVLSAATDGTHNYSSKSSKKGFKRYIAMVNGNYKFTSSLATYITDIQVNQPIQDGEILRLTIRLKKA